MNNRIDFSVEGHIANIRMTRADKMNALDNDMMDALIDASARLKQDKDIRVAVLSGEGRAFCAGLDKSNFSRMAEMGKTGKEKVANAPAKNEGLNNLAKRTHGLTNRVQQCTWGWREAPVPVIAAAHGVALGGGFQIYLGADIRYAAPDTRFSILEMRWGLVPDMGATHMMCQLAREDIVKELAFSGRIFESKEAYDTGFVTRIVEDPLSSAMETAQMIVKKNPDAIRGAKRVFNEGSDIHARETLLLESVVQDGIIGYPNQLEAVMSELENREPKFKNAS